ncbi:MAG: S-layer glycoprotein N-glycosyltransferase AglJ [Halovenus sp.]
MVERDLVCILVPTYNEAPSIAGVVERFRAGGFENVLVIDGGSTDGTQDLAREAGARVVEQSGSGKGQAVREAIGYISAPYVLLVDGDATYRPEQADRMLEPLFAGDAEHVIGNRFADMQSGAMSRLNRLGNGLINRAFRFIHGRDFGDILSGYRAFTRESFERLSLSAEGFGIETEMAVECVRRNVQTTVVPITYESRPEESQTNLRPIRDGGVIILTLYQMARTNNPLFYFGSLGVLSILTGALLAVYVAWEWFLHGISHNILALVSGVSVLFGLQLVMFGVLSDLVVTMNREHSRRIERLSDRLPDAGDTVQPSGERPDGTDAGDRAPATDGNADSPQQEELDRGVEDRR